VRCALAALLCAGCCLPSPPDDVPPAPGAGAVTPPPVAHDAGPLPLVPIRSRVHINSAGTSELTLTVRNDTRQAIDSFRFRAECYDNFNQRVLSARRRDGPEFRGESADRVNPGQTRRLGEWPMFRFDRCTKAIVTIEEVHFVDDTTWSGHAVQIEDPREPE
jgi:hypothetical protein